MFDFGGVFVKETEIISPPQRKFWPLTYGDAAEKLTELGIKYSC
jgi:hypothetical protein